MNVFRELFFKNHLKWSFDTERVNETMAMTLLFDQLMKINFQNWNIKRGSAIKAITQTHLHLLGQVNDFKCT